VKKSQIQIAIDKVNAEISALVAVKERLEAVASVQPKLKAVRKAKPPKPGITQDGSQPERMRG
jgi:hypothetical protein